MIPLIDAEQCIADLSGWGWIDYKIEVACGLSSGYISQIRCGKVRSSEMGQGRAKRLYNFWESEAHARGIEIPAYGSPIVQTRVASETST